MDMTHKARTFVLSIAVLAFVSVPTIALAQDSDENAHFFQLRHGCEL